MFQFSWLHNNPPVPNLASSNNKLFLCHGPVGWESRCGLAGSLTLGSFTGCPEGVGSGCSCLVAGLGQNSFPASLRGLLLRLVPHKLSDRWPLFFAGCWTEAPLAPWHMGSYIMVAGFLPSEGERDLVWPRSIRGLWGSSLWLPEAQSFLFHHGVELHSRNRSQFVLQLIVFFFFLFMFIQSCLTLWDPMDYIPLVSYVHGILQARILELGCFFLLQGIFPTHGSNLGHPHCRQILYCLSHQGSPW